MLETDILRLRLSTKLQVLTVPLFICRFGIAFNSDIEVTIETTL